MTYNSTVSCEWITILITLFTFGIFKVNCNECTDKAKNVFYLPVVRFCSDDSASGNPVVMDGFFADTQNGISQCKCVARITSSPPSSYELKYISLSNLTSIHNTYDCGSTVNFIQSNIQTKGISCIINGSLENRESSQSSDIMIVLQKTKDTKETRYCFKLELVGSSTFTMKIECDKAGVIEGTTVDGGTTTVMSFFNSSKAETTESSAGDTEISSKEPTQYFSGITNTTQQVDNNSKNQIKNVTEGTQNDVKGGVKVTYIAIGCGAAVVILAVIAVICLIKRSRKNERSSKDSSENNVNEEDNGYGLQYNALYVTNDDYAVHQQNKDDKCLPKTPTKKKKLSYKATENYSELTLNGIPNAKNYTDNIFETAMSDEFEAIIDGNYSEIDLIEKRKSVNVAYSKDDQENKCFETSTKLNVAKTSSSVRHVVSPGENGCEYAVVDKTKRF